jgi:hypothetical protein
MKTRPVRATSNARRARRSTIGDRNKECNARDAVLSFAGSFELCRTLAGALSDRLAVYYRASLLFIAALSPSFLPPLSHSCAFYRALLAARMTV